jgi:hypothetical protein
MCIFTFGENNVFIFDFLHFSEKLQMEVREYHKLQSESKLKKSTSIEENYESPKKRSLLTGILSGTVGD